MLHEASINGPRILDDRFLIFAEDLFFHNTE